MRKTIIFFVILLFTINYLYSERYEPAIGKSGSVIDAGNIRFLLGWGYNELKSDDNSKFNFGLDFGAGQTIELQNRIDYNSANSSDYEWTGWTELLKFKLSESEDGPAYSLGLGVRIPVRKAESLGLVAGLYVSSAIKDIDFDFNLGFNPFLTYADLGRNEARQKLKIRPNHYVNINLLLGYKLLPFFKITGGFESRQLLKGSEKIDDEKNDIDGGSNWEFLIGARVKPIDYPVLFDGTISAGSGNRKEYAWQFRLGVQILPQSPDAEW